MFQNVFRNLDNILRQEAGCATELDYAEQSSWLLFLKYLDDIEDEREQAAELAGKAYKPVLEGVYQWRHWAAPRGADGKIDHKIALTGDDLLAFVNDELFPYLRGFHEKAQGAAQSLDYKIGEIFLEIKNKFASGYLLRDAVEEIDTLRFKSQQEKHDLSELYEAKIRNMGNAGRNGGEYYTPRPLIRAMIGVIDPQIGETIYDGAAGSAGFLCEAFERMRPRAKTTKDLETLQNRTFKGKEKKSLAYVIGVMNMILHGIDAPHLLHTNTLEEPLSDIKPSEQVHIVLANPPFGGKERKEVQQNFAIKTGETAYLFLQHFMRILRPGGRAAVVIKNTFLSNADGAARELRKDLLQNHDLQMILDCPAKTFQGAGVKTVVLFFTKGSPTRRIWHYQLDPGRSLGKTNALTDADFEEFLRLAKTRADGPNSWSRALSDVDAATWDLSIRNPNRPEEEGPRGPAEILEEISALDAEAAEILERVRGLL